MSSPVAVIGLTYRGTDIQMLNGIFLEIVRGLGDVAAVRGVDIIVPARAGRIVRNRVGDVLSIELQGICGGSGANEAAQRSDFAGRRAAMRALFDPKLDPGALVATLEDATTATIAARSLNIVWDQVVPALARVSVELESVDPDWVVV